MEVYTSERRISRRLQFKTPLRVRVWKAGPPKQLSESENLSERGTFSPPTRHWLLVQLSKSS